MSSPRRSRRFLIAVVVTAVVFVILGVVTYFLWLASRLPGPDSPIYRQFVDDFEVGLAALDTEQAQEIGGASLDKAVALIPEEPAGWADRGLMYLRAHQLPQAGSDLAKAHELAPRSPEVEALLGWLAEEEGKYADAVVYFQKAVQGRPRNLRYLFALAEARQKQGGPDSQAEYQRLIEDGLKIDPDNLFLLRERMATAVDRGDRAAVNDVTDRLARFAPKWDELGRTTFQEFVEAVHKGGPLPGEVEQPSQILANVIASQQGYQRDLAAASPPAGLLGEPVARFLRLAPMPVVAAAPDLSLTFTPEPLAPAAPGAADAPWAVWLTAKECQATVYVADARQVRRADGTGKPLPFPGGAKATPPSPFGLVAADFDNDFRTGFLLAGRGRTPFLEARSRRRLHRRHRQDGTAGRPTGRRLPRRLDRRRRPGRRPRLHRQRPDPGRQSCCGTMATARSRR